MDGVDTTHTSRWAPPDSRNFRQSASSGRSPHQKDSPSSKPYNPPRWLPISSSHSSRNLAFRGISFTDWGSIQGSHARVVNSKPLPPVVTPSENEACVQKIPPAPAKIIDLIAPQTCRNKGCGKTFKEKDNHDSACEYHPGPAIFHDRMRGWKCCDVHVKEFDEFMSIPPCSKGWHNADPVS